MGFVILAFYYYNIEFCFDHEDEKERTERKKLGRFFFKSDGK